MRLEKISLFLNFMVSIFSFIAGVSNSGKMGYQRNVEYCTYLGWLLNGYTRNIFSETLKEIDEVLDG
jgi:hypothetical protein